MQDETTITAVAPQPAAANARDADGDNVCRIGDASAHGFALVPCGHAGFCEYCANRLNGEGRGCPICRDRIDIVYP